jgi:hypothetical protein
VSAYRDDDEARSELAEALERDKQRAEERAAQLAQRVAELEEENRFLRAQLAKVGAPPPAHEPSAAALAMKINADLVFKVDRLIELTADARMAKEILAAALPIDGQRIVTTAKEIAAANGAPEVSASHLKSAVRKVLPARIITRGGSPRKVVDELLDRVFRED